MKKKMFNPITRCQTKGVNELLSDEIKNFLWNHIDDLNMKMELDYLQVFEFRVVESDLIIEHRQEIPVYKKKHILKSNDLIYRLNGVKVFVVDNYNYSIMMLSTEY